MGAFVVRCGEAAQDSGLISVQSTADDRRSLAKTCCLSPTESRTAGGTPQTASMICIGDQPGNQGRGFVEVVSRSFRLKRPKVVDDPAVNGVL